LVCVQVLALSRLIATPKSDPTYHRPRSSGACETEWALVGPGVEGLAGTMPVGGRDQKSPFVRLT
jgi:hypothetical protein